MQYLFCRNIKTAQKDLEKEHKNAEFGKHTPSVTSKVTNMPPNFPEKTVYPDFKEFFKAEQERTQEKEKPQENQTLGNKKIKG